MNVLVVGVGNISYRHISNVRSLYPDSKIIAWRHKSICDENRVAQDLQLDLTVYNLRDALRSRPDVALITCPASLHIDRALKLAEAGVHLFVEKPLSDSMDGVANLIDLCASNNLKLMVGYNLRFFEPVKLLKQSVDSGLIGRVMSVRAEAGQYLPYWRPAIDYRNSVSARSALGGGVVFELSHEVDYLNWIFGPISSVAARIDRLSDLEIDVEDTAEIIVLLQNRAIGSIHLDMTQRPQHRSCKIVGTDGTLKWDNNSNTLICWSASTNCASELYRGTGAEYDKMYIDELSHFFDCVQNGSSPISSGEEAARTLRVILSIKLSSSDERFVKV